MTTERPRPEDDDPNLPTLHQDGFRQVYFGQLSDPLVRAHPEPAEAEEDELTRAALSDPEAARVHHIHDHPTPWRVVFLLLVAAFALGIVFFKR